MTNSDMKSIDFSLNFVLFDIVLLTGYNGKRATKRRRKIMTSAKVCIMIAIIIYLGGMLYIGYMCSRKMRARMTFIWEEESWGHL